MDLYYKQELTVGGLVLAALVLLVVGLMWLTGQSFRTGGRVLVPVQFGNVGGLNEGDPVQISGVRVGRVAKVHLLEVGKVRVELEVDKKIRPHVDATAEVKSLDFLGAKYIAYSPGTAEAYLPDGSAIVGKEESEIASSAVQLTDEARRTLTAAQDLLSPDMAKQIHEALASTERAMNVVTRLGNSSLVSSAESTLASIHGAAQALDTTLSNPAINESLSQLDEIAESVQEMTDGLAAVTQNLAQLLQQMQSPDGTVGKMLTDSTLYMHETLVAMRKLLDDLREHPGRYINVKVF